MAMTNHRDDDRLATLAEEGDDDMDNDPSFGRPQADYDDGGLEGSMRPPQLRRAITEPDPTARVSFSTLASGVPSPPVRASSLPPEVDTADAAPVSSVTKQPTAKERGGLFGSISFAKNGSSLDDNILRQSALRRSTARGSRQFTSSTKAFARRSTAMRSTATSNDSNAVEQEVKEQDKARARYRRYRVGDSVLVSNSMARGSNLVNRYGYPAGGGVTPEEMRGPYTYVLATVKKVHFEEDAEYYTVTRADTGADQRADTEWMEPLKTARGEAAALRAATEASQNGSVSDRGVAATGANAGASNARGRSGFFKLAEIGAFLVLSPLLWMYDSFLQIFGQRILAYGHIALFAAKRQGQLFVNGMKPFSFSMRLTTVNLLVICSTWHMFIDQARLAFLPRSADYAAAIVSLIVWCILVVELIFEVFIRPDGYHFLIVSEKAYSPSTVRYINAFHLTVEIMMLAFFVPEFVCLPSSNYGCSDRMRFSYFNAAFMAILGPNRINAFLGRAYVALIRFRVFGLVRHWKKMWINKTFVNKSWKLKSEGGGLLSGVFAPARVGNFDGKPMSEAMNLERQERKEDALINASNIGTALMVTNSHRALMIVCAIMGIFPLIKTLETWGGTNRVANQMVEQLQAINLELKNGTDPDECAFFFQTLFTWVAGITGGSKPAVVSDSQVFLLFLSVEPVRCTDYWSGYDGVPTASYCYWFDTGAVSHPSEEARVRIADLCEVWRGTTHNTTIEELANRAGIRSGAVSMELNQTVGTFTSEFGSNDGTTFTVTAKFNHTYSIQPAAFSSFLLQIALLVCVLGGLSILRRDSGLLVLGPLRRMLKIVARYAKNPLSEVKVGGTDSDDEDSEDDNENDSPEGKLGNYETEQLINAVSKITDLLRKCWGVAGADIISTNLATREGALTEVFNPTVPGKSVYALFGFAAINGFDHTLRQLGGDVMILINDVAAVLHGEVFRWGFGDSGQCNKNLGAAFLMVFRIGLVKEVIQKLEQATDVVFSNSANKKHATGILKRPTHNKRNSSDIPMSKAATRTVMAERRRKTQRTNSNRAAMSVSLQSLPGIQTFTDRAVVGMLKSFAGIYRDNKLLSWKNDFRLGAGVGAFSVNMIFGMDAGWAVEGAVGSEYKIDATYLSPHVNMASRMMSACKQYGVSILLSQAVQELMSGMARSKLRHLDTITVKGSSLKQKIYTYDARHKGVDFFLFSRSDEQADVDSDRYSPNVWNTDQDLRAMRQHVTEDFEFEFNKGRDAYLAGDWPKALKHLEAANEIMVENVMDQGYIQDELNELQNRVLDGEDARAAEEELRNETGDGPSRRLIAYMESEGKVPPEGWKGYRPLTSK